MKLKTTAALGSLAFLLYGCATGPDSEMCSPDGPCTGAPKRATSKPYQIKGVWYYPQQHYEYEAEGIASYYGGGDVFHGRPTATGERFDMNGVTAAHKTLPLPCIAEVTNLKNGRKIVVKVNDRGPFVNDRIIDVSRRVAQLLGFEQQGTTPVRVKTLVTESLSLNSLEASKVALDETIVETPMAAPTKKIAVASLEPVGSKAAASPKKVIATPSKPPLVARDTLPDVLPDDFFKSIEPQEVVVLETKPLIPQELPASTSPKSVSTSVPKVAGNGRGIYVEVPGKAAQVEKLKTFAKGLNAEVKPTGGVRLGPLPSQKDADLVLDHLVDAGYREAKMIIR